MREWTLIEMKAMMNQANQDEKLEQNEELANLRANTSIEKTILSKTLPSTDSMLKIKAIWCLMLE
jgi:serine phosphatase RsbU (regulator of sigma subunit)